MNNINSIMRTCFYYGKKEKPNESDEGVAWIDPEDGSDPIPDLVHYRKEKWFSTGLDGEPHPVSLLGKVLCIQKLIAPNLCKSRKREAKK